MTTVEGCTFDDVDKITDAIAFDHPDVVVDGDTLYLSGLVSEDMDTGELVAGDMTTETRQVLNNLERILKQYGSDMSHVLRVDVLLSDFSLRNEMNAEYIKHFPQEKIPARVCYGGVDLAAGCKIEIVAIAKKA